MKDKHREFLTVISKANRRGGVFHLDGYYQHIIRHLTFEDVAVLGVLLDKDATAAFKAIRRNEVYEESELSLANFRKTIGKLTATHMIEVVTGGKEHRIFLTTYGQEALELSLEEVE
jgi:hypothetical protein